MADLDKLSIGITASTTSATKRIDALCEKLTELSGIINKLDTSKFESLSNSANALGTALKDLKGATFKGVDKLAKSVESLGDSSKSMDKVKEGAQNISETAQTATNSIASVGRILEEVSGENLTEVSTQFKALSSDALTADNSVKGLKGILSNLKIIIPTKDLEKVSKDFEKVKNKAQELKEQIDYKSTNVDGYIDSDANKADIVKLEGLINELERLKLKKEELESHGGSYQIDFNSDALKKAKNVISEIGTNISTATSKIAKFIVSFSGIPSAINLAKNSVNRLKYSFDKLTKSVSRTYKMLRLMVVRMTLRAVIKDATDGIKNLIMYSDKFDSSVSLLWNSMRQLGNSLAAAASPIINAITPALNILIQKLIEAVNWVNQLVSSLLGLSTWTKAKQLTDDYRTSLDKTSKSAKKLKGQLLGFDALNNITSNDSGSALTDAKDMFEEIPISNKMKDLADWLKQMWKLGDFYDLGKKLGTKLKDWLDAIPWNKIRKTSNKLGKSLATLINGFTSVEGLGESIGNSIAQSLNTIFEFVNGFVKNLNWVQLGKFIADTFNGFFENIDWDLIKDTVITGLKGVADAINSFIQNFNWDNISNSISNVVNIIAKGLYTFFSTIDFYDLGSKLGEQLRKTIEKIDWVMLGNAIGTIIQSAINFVKGFLEQQSFVTIIKALTDLIKGFFEKVDVGDIALIATGIIGSVLVVSVSKLIAAEAMKRISTKILCAIFGTSAGEQAVVSAAETATGGILGKLATSPVVATAATVLGSAIIGAIAVYVGNKVIDFAGGIWEDAILSGMRSGGYSEAEIEAKKKDIDETLERYEGLKGKLNIFADGFKLLKGESLEANDSVKQSGIIVEDLTKKTSEASDKTKILVENLTSVEASIKNSSTFATTYSSSMKNVSDSSKSFSDSVKDINEQLKSNSVEFTKNTDNLVLMNSKAQKSFNDFGNKVNVTYQEVGTQTRNFNATFTGEVHEISKSMDETAKNISSSSADIKKNFTTDKWTLNGVKVGFTTSFNNAIKAVKEIIGKFAIWLNEKFTLNINPITIGGKQITSGTKIKLFHIPGFAMGGFPEDGLFMANSGEMVGGFSNGKTAVANNAQIVDGIKYGVSSAMSEQNSILLQQNELLRELLNKEFGISEGDLFRSVQSSANSYQKRTGRYAFNT